MTPQRNDGSVKPTFRTMPLITELLQPCPPIPSPHVITTINVLRHHNPVSFQLKIFLEIIKLKAKEDLTRAAFDAGACLLEILP